MSGNIDEDRLIHDNRLIAIKIEQLANSMLSTSELTAVQANILEHILKAESGTTLTAIHREFDCSMGSLSCILKRLREKGYIRIESCESDDRQKLIFATEKGKLSGQSLSESLLLVKKRAYGGFTSSELAMLDAFQKKVLRNLSEPSKPQRLEE